MKDEIEYLILDGNFAAVQQMMSETDFMAFEEAFISAAYDSESIMFYTFIAEMIKAEETVELHDLAFLLLVYPLSDVNGAFNAAYYHAKRSVVMTGDKEIKSLLQLLFLYAVPDPVVSDKEAFTVAKEILKQDPNNKVARTILKQTAKKLDSVVVDINHFNHMKNA
ncbi:hypothetical protein [Macrococcus equipercicus]|uniref:Uncharacterized protein n=1 Tax=Macrococcus equipercicus TaxID=69967 RepID=A0A9Q9BVY8_9STAP|nr:hypothetical protein [Macrococcus equipercicus]UTH14237.1 hypothetical protein KFV11_02425 [Macrococcus equipercicus]